LEFYMTLIITVVLFAAALCLLAPFVIPGLAILGLFRVAKALTTPKPPTVVYVQSSLYPPPPPPPGAEKGGF
jgi:hypothetical protein